MAVPFKQREWRHIVGMKVTRNAELDLQHNDLE